MGTTLGLILIEGINLADLADLGLYPTEAIALGREVLLGQDPGAAELAGGVLIAQGQMGMAMRGDTSAQTFGSRVVAIGVNTTDNTHLLSVFDRDGVRRHIVDTLEDRAFEIGEPLPEEELFPRLTTESTIALFEHLTGVSLADAEEASFSMLRSVQDHDHELGISLLHRLLGWRSIKDGH